MIAVSSTTPLRYLISIGHENLLGQLFEKVFVPVAVYEELTDAKTPEDVRRRVLSPPAWFEVRPVRELPASAFPVMLHRGEREAILLAEALRSDVLLIDEQIGRSIALRSAEELYKVLANKSRTANSVNSLGSDGELWTQAVNIVLRTKDDILAESERSI